MQSLFHGDSVPASLPGTSEFARQEPVLHLLVELTPWYRVFFGNLTDRLLFRRTPPLSLASQPGEFWDDVFVPRGFPLAAFRQSALYHVFLVTMLWGVSHTYLMRTRPLPSQNPFAHQTITYYSVSEYLPALSSPAESAPAVKPKKAEPEYAKQRIVSIPRNPESHAQTVVAPPKLKLPRDIPLPNIVAWTPDPGPVPMAAATHAAQQLVAPAVPAPVAPAPQAPRSTAQEHLDLEASVAPPAPTVGNARLRMPPDLVAKTTVVEPPPSLARTQPRAPDLPLPSAIEPPPAVPNLRRPGDMNMAAFDPKVAAPSLPVAEQRARGSLLEGPGQRAGKSSGPPVRSGAAVAPPPSLSAPNAGGSQNVGQLIALGIHPTSVTGPIRVPQGSRSGIFEAGPHGKSGAPGTPEIKGGGTTDGFGGSATNPNPHNSALPAGISVEPGASTPDGRVVVAATPKPAPPRPPAPTQNPLLASLNHPSVADLARRTSPNAAEPKIEDEVFGTKKYYSMTLNMPNLVSSSGSWIIRFAELRVSHVKGELTAPVAVQKVDPAYPTELMRQRVEGTVVLYAIIRADGTVADVRVLHGVDDRLDQYARVALAKWRFRPGTKNGTAIDLEAVVQIPFTSKHLPF